MGDISKHFSRSEFACKCGCGQDTVDSKLITELETYAENIMSYGVARVVMIIISGNRCVEHNNEHNKGVGGSSNSQHLYSKAVDFKVFTIDINGNRHVVHADDVADKLEYLFPEKYGIGRYNGRTHFDVRDDKARWDKR